MLFKRRSLSSVTFSGGTQIGMQGVIGALCDSLDSLDEPEAKASMVWIIGEYADRIDNAEDLLDVFLETFSDEAVDVQLQLLTATVKLFLKKTLKRAARHSFKSSASSNKRYRRSGPSRPSICLLAPVVI